MKKLLCILLLLFCIIGINSQTILTLGRVKVDGLNIARSGENLLVSMNIDVAGIDMPSSREVSFAPVLRAENNELFLSPVVLAGRNRYYFHLRNDAAPGVGISLFRAGHDRVIHYSAMVP